MHQRGRIAPGRWEGTGRHKSVKRRKGRRMATERQEESRVTRRTQNSEESIDSQKGARQPVQLQAVSVEHHRRRIARRPVVARAQQFRRRLSSKLLPRRVLQDSEQGQRRNMGASVPTFRYNPRFIWSTPSGGSRNAMKDPSKQADAEWPECAAQSRDCWMARGAPSSYGQSL